MTSQPSDDVIENNFLDFKLTKAALPLQFLSLKPNVAMLRNIVVTLAALTTCISIKIFILIENFVQIKTIIALSKGKHFKTFYLCTEISEQYTKCLFFANEICFMVNIP